MITRTVSFLLVCAVLVSGLPAKVWACELDLCPMEHQETESDKASQPAPCHGHSSDSNSNALTESKSNGLAIQTLCPCPNLDTAGPFTIESRSFPKLSQLKLNSAANGLYLHSQGTHRLLFRMRPPPFPHFVRLHLTLQVFLI